MCGGGRIGVTGRNVDILSGMPRLNFPTGFQNYHASTINIIFLDLHRLHAHAILSLSYCLCDHDAEFAVLNKFFVMTNVMNDIFKNKSRLITNALYRFS
jgi:hypothetical protein